MIASVGRIFFDNRHYETYILYLVTDPQPFAELSGIFYLIRCEMWTGCCEGSYAVISP